MQPCLTAQLLASLPTAPAAPPQNGAPSSPPKWELGSSPAACSAPASTEKSQQKSEPGERQRGEELSSAPGVLLEKGCTSRFSLCEALSASSGPAALDTVLLRDYNLLLSLVGLLPQFTACKHRSRNATRHIRGHVLCLIPHTHHTPWGFTKVKRMWPYRCSAPGGGDLPASKSCK